MRKLIREPTLLTLSTRSVLRFAKEPLRQPQGESLFSNPGLAMKQKALRQGSPSKRISEALAQRVVTEERNDGHATS